MSIMMGDWDEATHRYFFSIKGMTLMMLCGLISGAGSGVSSSPRASGFVWRSYFPHHCQSPDPVQPCPCPYPSVLVPCLFPYPCPAQPGAPRSLKSSPYSSPRTPFSANAPSSAQFVLCRTCSFVCCQLPCDGRMQYCVLQL